MHFFFRKAAAMILLLVFSLIMTPHEVFHAFHHHEDTHCYPHKGFHFENHHIHCPLFHLTADVFIKIDGWVQDGLSALLSVQMESLADTPYITPHLQNLLRGPPDIV